MDTLTVIHVVISLIGILSGLVVTFGMITRRRLDRWTAVFLGSTAATSATGFLFPFHGFTPAIGVGIISLVVLAIASFARYVRRLAGAWRWIYVVTAAVALYFNCFVLVVQLFQKLPVLKALAPTQSEPPFAVTQLIVLVIFIVLALAASIRFRVVHKLILATLLVWGVGNAQDTNSGRRLTPSEINAIASIAAGAGTSGVDGIQTHFWQTLSPHPETFSEAERRLYAKSYAEEGAMRAAFEMFKTLDTQDAADNRKFAVNKLPMPVLTIEGDKAMGGALEAQAKHVATNVTSIVFTDTGHWLMEQRPAETKAALKKFFSN